MSEIKVGDMIKCRDSDDCVETMQVLSKEGIEKRMDRIKKVTKKSYKGCEACRWHNLNGGTCKGGKARCGQFVAEKR